MRLPTEAEVIAVTETIVTRAFRAAPVEWRKEMALCLFYAAQENPVLRVDHVWEVFYRRASGIEYKRPYGMGRVMRLGLDFGWITPISKPKGTPRVRANHNDRGTLTYQSVIFDPAAKEKNAGKVFGTGIPTLQMEFPVMMEAV